MLNQTGFDLWAEGYDKSVGISDDNGTYPFAGYKKVLNEIYNRVLTHPGHKVLDIGFGTAVLTAKLYANGCQIFGQDFSARMIALAQAKMPDAKLYQGDFTEGLVEPLQQQRYDAIVATYSLHHLTDPQKVDFLKMLLSLLTDGGSIYIGDVAFPTRALLEDCKTQTGAAWDADEIYFVCDEMKQYFPALQFEKMSDCSGILSLNR